MFILLISGEIVYDGVHSGCVIYGVLSGYIIYEYSIESCVPPCLINPVAVGMVALYTLHKHYHCVGMDRKLQIHSVTGTLLCLEWSSI